MAANFFRQEKNWRLLFQLFLGSVVVVPLVFSGQLFYPFISAKILFFRLLVEIAVILFTVYLFLFKRVALRISLVAWLVLAWVATIFFSGVFGVNFAKSFWSNMERGEGIVFFLHLAAYFFLLLIFFKDRKSWFWLFRSSFVVALAVIAYGLMQHFSLFGAVNTTGLRISSTLGNPAYLGSYLLMNIFLALYLLVTDRNIYWRIFYIVFAILSAVIVFMTETRGAILGLFLGCSLLAAILLFSRSKKIVKLYSLAVIVAIVLFLISLFWFKDAGWVQNNYVFNKIASISASDYTVNTRLVAWRAAFNGFLDRPVLGWGVENFNYAFNKYFPPEIYVDAGSRLWFDKAHSVLFEYLVTTGLVGTAAYFGLLLAAAVSLLRSRSGNFLVPASLVALLAGYTFANMFVFDTLSAYILFIFVLALINNDFCRLPERSFKINWLGGGLLVVLSVVFAILGYQANYKATNYNRQLFLAEKAVKTGELGLAKNLYLATLKDNGSLTLMEIRKQFYSFVLSNYKSLDDNQAAQLFNEAITEAKKSLDNDPDDLKNYYDLSQLYLSSASFDVNRINSVIELGPKMIALSPTRSQTYNQLGDAYFRLKKYDQALENFQQAIEINPNLPDGYVNVYITASFSGEETLAEQARQQLVDKWPNFFDRELTLTRLAPVYKALGWTKDLEQVLIKLTEIKPDNANYILTLANFYAENGQSHKARELAQSLLGQDQALNQAVNNFLNKLK